MDYITGKSKYLLFLISLFVIPAFACIPTTTSETEVMNSFDPPPVAGVPYELQIGIAQQGDYEFPDPPYEFDTFINLNVGAGEEEIICPAFDIQLNSGLMEITCLVTFPSAGDFHGNVRPDSPDMSEVSFDVTVLPAEAGSVIIEGVSAFPVEPGSPVDVFVSVTSPVEDQTLTGEVEVTGPLGLCYATLTVDPAQSNHSTGSCPIVFESRDQFEIIATYTGPDEFEYLPGRYLVRAAVGKYDPIINVVASPNPIIEDEAFTLNIDVSGAPVSATGPLQITQIYKDSYGDDSVEYSMAVEDGTASISMYTITYMQWADLSSRTVGKAPDFYGRMDQYFQTFEIYYEGDVNYNGTTITVQVPIGKGFQELSLASISSRDVTVGDEVLVVVQATGFTFPESGAPLIVTWILGEDQCEAILDAAGRGECTLLISDRHTSITSELLMVDFAGDDANVPLSGNFDYVTINGAEVTLVLEEISSREVFPTGDISLQVSANVNGELLSGEHQVNVAIGADVCTITLLDGIGDCTFPLSTEGVFDVVIGFGATEEYPAVQLSAGEVEVLQPRLTVFDAKLSPHVVFAGQTVEVIATIAGVPDLPPTGTISMWFGEENCFAEIISGLAKCHFHISETGGQVVEIFYLGDGTYDPASTQLSFYVQDKVKSAVSIHGPVDINPGSTVTYKIKVTPAAGESTEYGTPTGEVTVYSDAFQCVATLVNGSAECALDWSSKSDTGNESVQVWYSGNTYYAYASNGFTQTFKQPTVPPAVSLTGGGPTGVVNQQAAFTVSYTIDWNTTVVPTGTITFETDNICVANLNGGKQITCPGNSFINLGNQTMKITYSGDGYYPSWSENVTINVVP